MIIDTNTVVSMTEANQNFSKATRIDDTDEPIHQLIYAVPLAV